MYRTNNPVMSQLRGCTIDMNGVEQVNRATYQGVALKALYFVLVAIASAIVSTVILFNFTEIAYPCLVVSIIGTFVFGFMAALMPNTIKVTGTLYTVCMGFLVGVVSAIFNYVYPGIVLAALLSTFGVFAVMTALYATGIIKVTHKFRSYMYSALLAIILINLIIFVVSLFSTTVSELFYGAGPLSILISVFMVLFASFFILVDLFEISEIVDNGLEKKHEWRAAYSLTLTLIWLYVEFLKLFAKLAASKK